MISPRDLLLPPNLLSLMRLLIGPAILILFDSTQAWNMAVCLGLIAVAECSDLADGLLARRLGHVTDLGKLLDPLADSVYRFCVFLALFGAGWMAAWMICIVFLRDIIVAYTRIYAAVNGIVLAARTSGKIKAVVQGAAQLATVILLLLQGQVSSSLDRTLIWCFLAVAVLVTAASGVDYVIGTARSTAARAAHD
jgi:CDP-diacylglycerol--glycerol-3-phosphate 3-phosphatidyltransferase